MISVAFIGLGAMGSGMAANLAKSGVRVAAYDVSAAALEQAKVAGCEIATSTADAVRSVEAVVTMLPAGQHVRQVYHDDIAPNAKPGSLLIDCSTIDIDSALAVAQSVRDRGFRFADAPVSGGIAAADAGTLTFMVGCADGDLAAVEAALAPMGKSVIHAGAVGAGQAAKICNNMLLGVSMLGVCESLRRSHPASAGR
jgi:3-hydroxyisobutyrate dehydrogenase